MPPRRLTVYEFAPDNVYTNPLPPQYRIRFIKKRARGPMHLITQSLLLWQRQRELPLQR